MTPILLLKTKSTPTDAYADYFQHFQIHSPVSDQEDDIIINFAPVNVPVLENRFHEETISEIERLIAHGAFDDDAPGRRAEEDEEYDDLRERRYGGIIFTSQRAVEAFLQAVNHVVVVVGRFKLSSKPAHHISPLPCTRTLKLPFFSQFLGHKPFPSSTVFYVVGPATHRALLSSPYIRSSNIHGSETGNGEALAQFIVEHYHQNNNNNNNNNKALHYDHHNNKTTTTSSLLFLVGKQHRDIIPPILELNKIPVEKKVVYETRLSSSFVNDLREALLFRSDHHGDDIWIVVFSPEGCHVLMDVLNSPSSSRQQQHMPEEEEDEEENQTRWKGKEKKVRIATIGPTTRDYLIEECKTIPNVCANTPTPEGVARGIRRFYSEAAEAGVGVVI